MDTWLQTGRPAILQAVSEACDRIDQRFQAEQKQSQAAQAAYEADRERQEADLGALRDKVAQLAEENRVLKSRLPECHEKRAAPALAEPSVDNGPNHISNPSERAETGGAATPMAAAANQDEAGMKKDEPDWCAMYKELASRHEAVRAKFSLAKAALRSKNENREQWIDYAARLEERLRAKSDELRALRAQLQEDEGTSAGPAEPRPATGTARPGLDVSSCLFDPEGGNLQPPGPPRGTERSPEPEPAVAENVELPRLPPAHVTAPAPAIKAEPSSDEPVVLSVRVIRKRKRECTMIKSEEESSDPTVALLAPRGRSPQETIDLDMLANRFTTPRKRRVSDRGAVADAPVYMPTLTRSSSSSPPRGAGCPAQSVHHKPWDRSSSTGRPTLHHPDRDPKPAAITSVAGPPAPVPTSDRPPPANPPTPALAAAKRARVLQPVSPNKRVGATPRATTIQTGPYKQNSALSAQAGTPYESRSSSKQPPGQVIDDDQERGQLCATWRTRSAQSRRVRTPEEAHLSDFPQRRLLPFDVLHRSPRPDEVRARQARASITPTSTTLASITLATRRHEAAAGNQSTTKGASGRTYAKSLSGDGSSGTGGGIGGGDGGGIGSGGVDSSLKDRPLAALRPDDFKINPRFNDGHAFAFSEVVRDRSERARLPGCVDPNCCGKEFRALALSERPRHPITPEQQAEEQTMLQRYLGHQSHKLADMSRQEREDLWIEAKTRELADKYGRHKNRYGRPQSPPGFWNADFPTTQELHDQKREAAQREREVVAQRYREAMRPGGRWLFRDE